MLLETAITRDSFTELGLNETQAAELFEAISAYIQAATTAEEIWSELTKHFITHQYTFDIQLFLFKSLFPNWEEHPELAPAWMPSTETIASANITQFMAKLGMTHIREFHAWSSTHYRDFWERITKNLGIKFSHAYDDIVALPQGLAAPEWFPGATLNITDSCFQAPPNTTAIIYTDKQALKEVSYQALATIINRMANGLVQYGIKVGDAVAIIMPMNFYAVAMYLAIIKMGGIVVSIADSFSSDEINLRLTLAKTKLVVTQDYSLWDGKQKNLYEKLKTATALPIIVIPHDAASNNVTLRASDLAFDHFLSDNDKFTAVALPPKSFSNILFSSGTTGEPKVIPWNHTTPIKIASDAFFHQNIQAGDVLAWPTNLGWMMGPWLVFAALINKATLALYTEAPKSASFGEFVEKAKVTMLGVVPTLVNTWRQSKCMESFNWHAIKVFSSTGESSNPEDMLYLMSLAGYKPVIEYCGGTEIGGAYVTSTVVENNYPSLFSTPAMGLNFTLLDEAGKSASIGEVAIIPPSIGLSTTLLNADHYRVYFSKMPTNSEGIGLRRHGDLLKRYPNSYYGVMGRVDDTMNLGGIKVSTVEIERCVSHFPEISEVAAIAIGQKGPSQLVIFVVAPETTNKKTLMDAMQKNINSQLNPLFKIHDIVFVQELPKTASNKILRRLLRQQYQERIH